MIIGIVRTNSFTKWITNTYLPQTAINFTSDISFSSSSVPVFCMIDQSYYRFMCFIIFIKQFWRTPIRIKNRTVLCSVQLLHLSRWKESYIKAEQQNLKPSLSSGEQEHHLALGFLSVEGDCGLSCLVKLPVLALSFWTNIWTVWIQPFIILFKIKKIYGCWIRDGSFIANFCGYCRMKCPLYFENIEELQENHIYVIMRLWCKTNSRLQWGKRNQFEEGETSTICISTQSLCTHISSSLVNYVMVKIQFCIF